MKAEDIAYRDGDVVLNGVLAHDPAIEGKRPGIIVFPEAFGLGDHAIGRAKMLAHLGYVALAADPYGGRRVGKNMDEIMPLLGDMMEKRAKLRARCHAALSTLVALPQVDTRRLAAIGFCLGGTMSLELARDGAALACVVSFHGNLHTPEPARKGAIKAKVLACHGADDPLVPPEQVLAFEAEMRAAGADWQLISYGGTVHSFTNPQADGSMPGILYNARTDKRSWAAMTSLFDEVFNASATVP